MKTKTPKEIEEELKEKIEKAKKDFDLNKLKLLKAELKGFQKSQEMMRGEIEGLKNKIKEFEIILIMDGGFKMYHPIEDKSKPFKEIVDKWNELKELLSKIGGEKK